MPLRHALVVREVVNAESKIPSLASLVVKVETIENITRPVTQFAPFTLLLGADAIASAPSADFVFAPIEAPCYPVVVRVHDSIPFSGKRR